jgi:hypothetical protein
MQTVKSRRDRTPVAALILAVAAIGLIGVSCHEGPPAASATVEPNALPFTLQFRPVAYPGAVPPLPALQSYAVASSDGWWLVLGGMLGQGLHKFNQSGDNFSPDSADRSLWAINPARGTAVSFPLSSLPARLAAPLSATNGEYYDDRASDTLYVAGGYGWKADGSDMTTFPTLIAMPVQRMIKAIVAHASPTVIAGMITEGTDSVFQVTGGALLRVNGTFVLPFGQRFFGQYRAFGGSRGGDTSSRADSLPFRQEYLSSISLFTLNPRRPLTILSRSILTSSDPSAPYHRRDGNFVDDIDPATGQPRVAGFGGVFPPGVIGGYESAVYVTPQGATVDSSLHQLFSQYICPVIGVWDSTRQVTYHTFFGGISNHYLTFSHIQDSVFKVVSAQGRNDGLPFISDISTLVENAAGQYKEWVSPQPIPDTLLVGATASFIPNDSLFAAGGFTRNGLLRLSARSPGDSLQIGWIYGGIEAQNPLPLFPSTGTSATNRVYAVWFVYRPSAGVPASAGHSATPDSTVIR